MSDPQTAGQGAPPSPDSPASPPASDPGAGGPPQRAQVEPWRRLPGAKTGDSPGGGLSPVQTSTALAGGGQASSREDLGKGSLLLANLAAYWDQLATDQQGISDLYAERDPEQSHVARGRSRQLTDCADQLRALISEET